MIRARWPGRFNLRAGGDGDLWSLKGFGGDGDLLESGPLGVECEGDRDRFRFLAASNFVALKG